MKNLLLLPACLFFGSISAQHIAVFAQKTDRADTITYLAPDFYKPIAIQKRDTIFRFECYDNRDSIINSVTDFGKVRYYSVFKNYIDSTHTYKDAQGKKQYLPVSKIVERFDRLGSLKWMHVAYPSNIITELKDIKTDIVNTDTLTDGQSGVKIYRYYRTEPVK
ncbi:MAG: hypothetical protein H7257_10340 [Taibaiella sp.]|nr:hypothetical protein [Taibaiella sp.]